MKYRMLTYGRLSEEFEVYLQSNHPEIGITRVHSESEIKYALPNVDAIAGFNFLEDEDVSHIKWIHAFGAGVDSYLKLKSLDSETIITRTTGNLGKQMGEFCLAYILAEIKSIFPIYEQQKNATWKQLPPSNLSDLNVLILGTGSIGQGIAQTLNGHVRKIIGLNRSGHPDASFHETCTLETISEAGNVHVVISALPSTLGTSSILDESLFKQFDDIIFINVGRGDAVNENDLIAAINSGSVKKAILDVFPQEPLPKDSHLWNNEKVLVSPHQSGLTTIEDVSSCFERAYRAIKDGERNDLFVDRSKGY